ncbi:MAG: 4Fe-4S binding protein [Planctomycetota bacterium]
MNRKKSKINLWRRITQTASVFLLNPYFYSFRQVCFPVLNCWGCPISAFSCPIGAMGQFFAQGVFPFLVLGTIVFFGAIIGRMLCGWVCPFGFLQDLLYKIPLPKINLPSFLKYGKYLTLLLMVIVIPLLFGINTTSGKTTASDFFFCYLCPAGTLEATIPNSIFPPKTQAAAATPPETSAQPGTSTTPETKEEAKTPNSDVSSESFYQIKEQSLLVGFLKSPRIWILIVFLALFVMISRPFCRVICPLGGMFALLNKVSIYKFNVDKNKCIECGGCNVCGAHCPDFAIYFVKGQDAKSKL